MREGRPVLAGVGVNGLREQDNKQTNRNNAHCPKSTIRCCTEGEEGNKSCWLSKSCSSAGCTHKRSSVPPEETNFFVCQVRIDHKTKAISFGLDLHVAHKEEVPEGPYLQVWSP